MRLFELPCEGWQGWHMHSGRLWSPEGFGFEPHDASWLGLLVRQAQGFGRQYTRANQLAVALQRLESAGDAMTATGVATSPPQARAPGGDGRPLGSVSAATSPDKEGVVTPSFFPVQRKNCTFFKQSHQSIGGAV